MAEQLLLCAENLFSVAQAANVNHTVTADEEATGYTVDRIANGRRQSADRWEPTTANADHYVRVICDTLRGADFLAIDRASNHRGYRYQLLHSADSFSTARTVLDVNTIPLQVGGAMSGALGAITTEGAWLKTFSADANRGWEVLSKAMGSGLVPQLTGVWLGKSYQPTNYVLRFPVEDQGYDFAQTVTTSPFGWAGQGQRSKPRSGTLKIGLPDTGDEDLLAYQTLGLMAEGAAAWLCWQKTDASWRAMLVRLRENTRLAFARDPSWHPLLRSLEVNFIEEQPL